MTDLDSKLRGEKNINYVSDSDEEECSRSKDLDDESSTAKDDVPTEINDLPKFDTSGPKTGPKGVLEDYRRYKELKKLQYAEETKERIALHKKHAFTVDVDKHKVEEEENFDVDDDDFLKKYHEKRLAQLQKEMENKLTENAPKFGQLLELNGNKLSEAIDKEDRKVIIVIHLYEDTISSCKQMNACLKCLAKQYPYIKFCKVRASTAGLSLNFKLNALPALQVYKERVLIGNFIKMQDKLDEEFYASDVENFLIDSDILTSGTNFDQDLIDSDYELD